MDKITYSSELKDTIQFAKNKGLFLGTGNPNARILILGKEAAIDKEKSASQYEQEYLKNNTDWELNYATNKQFSDIDNWFIQDRLPVFNTLYPYKGQKNKVERHDKIGKIISGNGGTSKTWYNYQKIIDNIYFNDVSGELINFHEHAFCSELNQETGNYSKDIPKIKRAESIQLRKELFATPFFKKFPITIVAVGHYVRDFDLDLQNIFEIKYHEKISKELSEGLNKEYINIHYDNLDKPTKLLIHTNQLSMVSNELVNRLGKICNDFLKRIQSN